jgi:hypothetical protein
VLIAIDRGAASVIPGEKLGQQSKSRIRRLLDFFAGEKKQNARIDGVDSSITRKSAALLRAEMQPTRVHRPTAMATMQTRPGRSTSQWLGKIVKISSPALLFPKPCSRAAFRPGARSVPGLSSGPPCNLLSKLYEGIHWLASKH